LLSLLPARLHLQSTGWTKKIAKILTWIKRDSPYYNMISDESQIWQGEVSNGLHAYACMPLTPACLAAADQLAAVRGECIALWHPSSVPL
jgi:hypothetical protein